MTYICCTEFVPRGISPRDTNNMKSIQFKCDTRNKKQLRKKAKEIAVKDGYIDRYSIRNHWEIFDIQIKFDNAPWNSYHELCEKLISHKAAHSWKSIEEHIYVGVHEGKESAFVNYIKDYYKGLNPTVTGDQVVRVTADPTVQ